MLIYQSNYHILILCLYLHLLLTQTPNQPKCNLIPYQSQVTVCELSPSPHYTYQQLDPHTLHISLLSITVYQETYITGILDLALGLRINCIPRDQQRIGAKMEDRPNGTFNGQFRFRPNAFVAKYIYYYWFNCVA